MLNANSPIFVVVSHSKSFQPQKPRFSSFDIFTGPSDGQTDRRIDGPTDGRTNGPTDTTSYRDAWSHLITTTTAKNVRIHKFKFSNFALVLLEQQLVTVIVHLPLEEHSNDGVLLEGNEPSLGQGVVRKPEANGCQLAV